MRTISSKTIRRFIAGLALFSLSGCYYTQLASGQINQWQQRELIYVLLLDPEVDSQLKRQLTDVRSMTEFAKAHYEIDATDSYRHYIDVGDAPPQWLVLAVPELSIEPKQWCYPIAGCVNYRNYWHRSDAEAEQRSLQSEGYDTAIVGASAWTTLGWFSDPIMSNWLSRERAETARVLFHEIAHRGFYVSDDPELNESFATFYGQLMASHWLRSIGEPAAQSDFDYPFLDAITSMRESLIAVFQTASDDQTKRAEKSTLFHQLQSQYPEQLNVPKNNAELALFGTYYLWVSSWETLWANCASSRQFHNRFVALQSLSYEERRRALSSAICTTEDTL